MIFQRIPVTSYLFLALLYLANFLISLGIGFSLLAFMDKLPNVFLLWGAFFICFLINSLLFRLLLHFSFRHVFSFSIFLFVLGLLVVNQILFTKYFSSLSYGKQLNIFTNYFLIVWMLVSVWSFKSTRSTIINIFISILSALLILVIYQSFSWLWALSLAVFVCFLACFLSEIDFKQRPFLRVINGDLAGHVFFICKEVFVIGSDSKDDLSLKDYYGVEYAHVKIVNYSEPSVFFLVDNYFDLLPKVNYHRTKERILEDRDILLVGEAKLQFFNSKA